MEKIVTIAKTKAGRKAVRWIWYPKILDRATPRSAPDEMPRM